jgi:hypothetical protein
MVKAAAEGKTPWAFRARFRRAAFGWNGSKLAIERIHDAHRLAIEAAGNAQQGAQAQTAIEHMLAADRPMSAWLRRALGVATGAGS